MFKKVLSAILMVCLCLIVMVGCESSKKDSNSTNTSATSVKVKNQDDPIILATMTDEESRIIGSMMKQVLEANGYLVDSRVGTFNNTTLARQSLMQKQVELSMDYTGRGMMFIKNVDIKKYQSDLKTAFETTKEADAKNGITWICYSKYNNTDGIAVSKKWAEENKIKTFDDFAKYINSGKEMKLAIAGEDSYAATAPTCLPGWEKAYGFKLSDKQVVVGVNDPKTMVANNTDGILACHTYTTAGTLEALDLVVIEDPKMVAPVYSPAPIALPDLLEKYPEIEGLMKQIFESLDAQKMMHMNKQLSVDGKSETDIAREYLKSSGILK